MEPFGNNLEIILKFSSHRKPIRTRGKTEEKASKKDGKNPGTRGKTNI